jgi:hypothetical protein
VAGNVNVRSWKVFFDCGCAVNGAGHRQYDDYVELYYTKDPIKCPIHGQTTISATQGWNW